MQKSKEKIHVGGSIEETKKELGASEARNAEIKEKQLKAQDEKNVEPDENKISLEEHAIQDAHEQLEKLKQIETQLGQKLPKTKNELQEKKEGLERKESLKKGTEAGEKETGLDQDGKSELNEEETE